MPNIEVRGHSFYYAVDDNTSPWLEPVTVVIQHGFGRNGRFWHHWVPRLAGQYRVVRRDQLGHGRSDAPPIDYAWTFQGLVEDLKEFIDTVCGGPVHYLGESAGGLIGIALASSYPDRLKTLTVCGTPLTVRSEHASALKAGYATSIEAKRALGSEGWAREMMQRRVLTDLGSPEYWAWAYKEISATPIDVLIGIGQTLHEEGLDVVGLLPSIAVPALVLAPTQSPITPLQDQVLMSQAIPSAQIVTVNGPGHEIYRDDPEPCIAGFLAFLAHHPSSAGSV